MKIIKLLIFIVLAVNLSSCGIRSIPMAKNGIEASEAEIVNQCKRRSDLIPNLVNTVKGYAKHEKEALLGVVEARAKATSVTINASDANSIAQFQKAQSGLASALSRLMAISERYPDLKANGNFRELQAQLEGTENRITVARQRHIQNIKTFNDLVTIFPTNIVNSWFFKFDKMPQWTVDNAEALKKAPPKVEF